MNVYVLRIWEALRPETHSNPNKEKEVYSLLLGTEGVTFGIWPTVSNAPGDFVPGTENGSEQSPLWEIFLSNTA